jgi:hypothetical protein
MADHTRQIEGMSTRALLAAMGATAVCTVPAAALLVAGLHSLRRTLLAADKLMYPGSPHWWESVTPAVLFGLIGLGFGALTAWRTSAAASLGGLATWLIAGANLAVFGAAGAAAAPFVFPSGIPGTCWISLASMMVCAVASLYLTLAWLD